MTQILVLGAGLVARPLVRYLLAQDGIEVVLGDQEQKRAAALIENHPSGQAVDLDVRDTVQLNDAVAKSDIVVSLLPWMFHPQIAALCLEHKKHLVTASYVKEEMQSLDSAAREKGLIFLNEVGVDPGIDHMAAMKTIDEIKAKGGEVTTFHSYCGGLPAMKNNNNFSKNLNIVTTCCWTAHVMPLPMCTRVFTFTPTARTWKPSESMTFRKSPGFHYLKCSTPVILT